MIRDPPPPYVSVGCPPCYSLAFSTLTHARRGLRVRKPGLRFNEPGPQGEKNNYLSRRRGEESPTPPRLFRVCIYSCVSEGGRCVSVRFCRQPRSLSAWERRQMVGDTAGWGADAMPQLSVCFLSFFSLFFTLSLPFLPPFYIFSTPVNLSLFSSRVPPLPPSLPSIHLSLSIMNISHRNAIYSLFLRSIHQAQISHLWVLSDWGWVSCHFQLSSVLRIMPFLFQSVMRDGWFTLICFYHRSTLINVYVTEKKWFHFGVVSLCDSTMKFLIACFSSALAHFKLKVRDGSKILSHKIYLFLNSLFSGIPYE